MLVRGRLDGRLRRAYREPTDGAKRLTQSPDFGDTDAMGRFLVVVFATIGLWFRRNVAWAILCFAFLLSACSVAGGSSMLPPMHIPQSRVHEVCWKPSELDAVADTTDTTDTGETGEYFVLVDGEGAAVSSKNRHAFAREIKAGGFIYKYVASAPIQNLRLVPLSRGDTWCNRIPKPTDEAVLKLLDPCATAALMPDGQSVAKSLVAQTEGATYRSPILCNQQPQMQWTTQQTISILSRKLAFQQAYDNYHKNINAFTLAAAQLQAVINNSDSWLKRKLTSDPGTVEEIQQRATDALNSIEEPLVYGDRDLDDIALAGARAGFEMGRFEAEEQLFAIDAGVMILEMVALEVALGPLGGARFLASAVSKGTRALTAAVSRLENIPIFLPLANGGAGAFVRVGEIVNAVRRGSSKKLADALITAGIKRPDGTDAHHIVALGHRLAAESRRILAQFGVKIDEAVNGVFLPSNMKSSNPKNAIVHATLANNHKYYKIVEIALQEAKSQADVIQILGRIRKALLDGTFYDARL